jgi:hypothetical protein
MIDANPGTRPSHLTLDRLAAGELSEAESATVRASIDAAGQSHLDRVEAARTRLPALDLAAIRARAATAEASPLPDVRPANTTWAFVGVFLAVAAVVLVLAKLSLASPPETVAGGGDIRFRAGDGLSVLQLVDDVPRDYVTGTPVKDGAVLGFQVVATGHHAVVVLSVDGTGQTTVFWPESGTEPEPLRGDGLVALPGSVVLDDAPGPEIFVAVYDRDVPSALRLVQEAWATGGASGVLGQATELPGVHAVEVTRKH